jgi:thiamine biosynthesis lipoprotein
MVSGKYSLFGSEVEFYLDADELFSEPALNDAYAYALRLQKIFNIYDPNSELSRLNKERHIKASRELLEVMNKALKLCKLSDGEYDISLGKQFLQRKKGQQLTGVSCSYEDIEILHNADVLVDLGSIAKGYIAENVAKFFIEQGIESGYVDARGDIRIFGDELEVGVQHPRTDGIICTVRVKDKGVATSGDYKQYVEEYSRSHILNQKDIISATVVADSLMDADAYATIMMVCSHDVREHLIVDSGFPTMIIDKDLNVHYYNGFEGLIIHED